MPLGELCNTADTRDVDRNGTVTGTTLGEQTEERGGDEVDRERVDLI